MPFWLPISLIALAGITVVALLVAAVRDKRPIRRLFSSAMQGEAALLAVNLAAAFTQVSLGFSWLAVGTCALLGIPGVVALVLLQIVLPLG